VGVGQTLLIHLDDTAEEIRLPVLDALLVAAAIDPTMVITKTEEAVKRQRPVTAINSQPAIINSHARCAPRPVPGFFSARVPCAAACLWRLPSILSAPPCPAPLPHC
jgi:hypothetical protein